MRWRTLLLPIALAAIAAPPAAGPIVFEEIAGPSGLRFVTDSSPTPNKNQPETMVSGVGLLGYDNDGYLDVYLVNGAAIPSLRKESPKHWNRLFHNNGNGTFSDVTEKAGVQGEGYGMGVAPYIAPRIVFRSRMRIPAKSNSIPGCARTGQSTGADADTPLPS